MIDSWTFKAVKVDLVRQLSASQIHEVVFMQHIMKEKSNSLIYGQGRL